LSGLAEAKGLLIYMLERMKARARDLQYRIQRVIDRIMASAQTIYERDNVYQRVALSLDDDKLDKATGRQIVASIIGDERLSALEAMMKTDPTPGYALAMVDSFEYQYSRGMGTHVAWMRTPFGQSNSMLT